MANLNFRFSQLGQYKGPKVYSGLREKNNPSKRTFSFRFVTDKECYDALRHLKVSKPQGPSSIPAWALKDAASELVPHLSFILNQSIKELSFPSFPRKPLLYYFSKKETKRIQATLDQFHSHHVYQKFLKLFSETKL